MDARESREEVDILNQPRSMQAAIVASALIFLTPAFAASREAEKGVETDKKVAAEIDGQKITAEELENYVRTANPRAYQEYYNVKRSALERLIAERLLAAEATAKGTTPEKLRQEIAAAAPAVTDADLQTFYDQNKARYGGRTLDQVKDQIRGGLASQRQQQAVSEFMAALKEKKDVRIHLEPPRADVRISENDPAKGPKGAPVQLVEFSDFQ